MLSFSEMIKNVLLKPDVCIQHLLEKGDILLSHNNFLYWLF